ncbi:hypothetical protein JCM10449v2_007774 [Rhodotorula kratochvilovae]
MQAAPGAPPLELDPALASLAAATAPGQHHALYSDEQLAHFAALDGYTAAPAAVPHPHPHPHHPQLPAVNIHVDPGAAAQQQQQQQQAVAAASGAATAAAASSSSAALPPPPSLAQLAPDGELPEQQPSLAGKATKDMTPAEKAANRKERNRLAAKKSRDKRQQEYDTLEVDRNKWKAEAEALRVRVQQLETILRTIHSSAQLPDEVVPPAAAEDHPLNLR